MEGYCRIKTEMPNLVKRNGPSALIVRATIVGVILPAVGFCNCGGIRWPFQSGNGLNYILYYATNESLISIYKWKLVSSVW